MILGSHNSMTYLKPAKWWMWFGRFVTKCQKHDYKHQYEAGVRYFDFRISYDRFGNPQFSHGLVDFKCPRNHSIYDVFEFLNEKKDTYCRILFEKGTDIEKEKFKYFVKDLIKKYPNLRFTQVIDKKTWTQLIDDEYLVKLPQPIKDCYASNNGYFPQFSKLPGILKSKVWSGYIIDDLWPWIYTVFNNKKKFRQYKNDDVVLLMDFISKKTLNY